MPRALTLHSSAAAAVPQNASKPSQRQNPDAIEYPRPIIPDEVSHSREYPYISASVISKTPGSVLKQDRVIGVRHQFLTAIDARKRNAGGWNCDRDARSQRRFQRVVRSLSQGQRHHESCFLSMARAFSCACRERKFKTLDPGCQTFPARPAATRRFRSVENGLSRIDDH